MKRSFYVALISVLASVLPISFVQGSSIVTEANRFAPENTAGQAVITTLPISSLSLCQGSAVVINFTVSGATFSPSNVFTAQLSDADGSFAAPVSIGNIVLGGTSVPSNTYIFGVIPGSIPVGANYRIRVVSSEFPAIPSLDNGADIAIGSGFAPSIPSVSVNGPTDFCFGSATTFLTSSVPNGNLWFPGGTNVNPFIGVTSSGCYYTQVANGAGCTSASVPVCINVNTPIFTFLAYFEDGQIASTADTTITICEGDSAEIGILIEGGVAPFDISYTPDGFNIVTVNDVGIPSSSPNTSQYSFFTATAGIYQTIGITDNFPTNCGSNGSSGTVIVQLAPPPVTSFSYEPFCGDASGVPVLAPGFLGGGVFSLQPDPGDGVTINASNGALSNTVIGATYTVQYTVQGPNCEAQSTTTVTVDTADVVEFSIAPFCSGNASVLPITVAGFAGGGIYSFESAPFDGASINAVTGVISNASPSTTYNIVYTSPAGDCQNTFTTQVTTLASPEVTATVTNSECGQSTGAIDVTVSSGVAPFSFSWSNGANTEDISGLASGAYTLSITDDQGCVVDTTISIINSNQPELVFAVNNASCGAQNGTIDLTINNGVGPYDINWTPAGEGLQLSNLAPGTYSVTVIDQGTTCEVSGSATVTQEGAPQATFTALNSLCAQAVGSIDVTVTGGTAPITHSWSNGQTTEDISGLFAGTYTDTISDANGCQIIISANIINENQFTATSSVTSPTCGNLSSGAIDVTIQGGDAPFTFAWSPNTQNVTEDVTGLSAGTYTVEITDDAGCEFSLESTINAPVPPTATADVTPSQCGQSTGAINVTVQGASGVFTYLWSNGETTEDISGLSAGDYAVTITDVADLTCTTSLNVSIENDNEPTVDVVTDNTSCTANTGSISITVNGGSGDFSFAWTGPNSFQSTDEDISSLPAGTYNVVVTDLTTTCTVEASGVVAPADAPEITSVFANTTCGQNNGLIDITVEGGTEPFNITWNGVSSTLDRVNLAPGTYEFLLVDANDCSVEATFEILPSIQPEIESVAVNPTCGNDTGSVDVTITGASGTIVYNWTLDGAPFATTQDINSLAPGTYIISATDGSGCIVRDTTTLIYENQPTLSFTTTETTCSGATGSIDLTIDGGTPPLNISWSGPDGFAFIGEDPSNLAAGCYTATVIDANTCQVTIEACVEDAGAPEIALNVVQPSCNQDNGSIEATLTGGTGNISFTWTPDLGQTLNPNNLSAGTYSIAVTDEAGCEATSSVTLVNTGLVNVTADQIDASCNANNGAIFLEVTGGVAPYTFLWTPNGEITESIAGLAGGTYSVVVTDAAGCEATGNFTIDETPGPEVTFTSTNALCGNDNGSIDVSVTGGSGNYSYVWTGNGITNPSAQDQENLAAGEYTLVVTDESTECEETITVTIINSNSFSLTSSVINTSCGADNGSITLTIQGAVDPLNILWSNESTGSSLENLAPGTYTVAVSDGAGCSVADTFTIAPSTPFSVDVISSEANCGLCNGAGTVVFNSGTGPYTYLWNNGSTDSAPIDLCAGNNTLIITDLSNGCIDTVNFVTNGSPAPTISFEQTNTNCGESVGAIDITVDGGEAPYFFTWNGPGVVNGSTEDLTGLAAGTYTLELLDANLCSASISVTITNANEPQLDFAVTGTECAGASGAIDLTVSNAVAPSFDWTGPDGFTADTEDLSGLASGTYTVTVTDGLCIVTESATVINEDGPVASISLSADTICAALPVVLTIDITGNGPFTFTYTENGAPIVVNGFSGNSFTATVTPSATTIFALVSVVSDLVPDCEGSFTTQSATVTVNPNPVAPTITASGPTSFCEGGSVILTSSASTGNIWNIAGPDQFNQSITVTTAGSYAVSVINQFGCADTSEAILVDVIPSGIQASFNDTTVCAGTPIQFSATGGSNYVWSPSIYLSGTIIANPVATPFANTTYVVTATGDCGTGTDTITVNVLPIVNADLGGDITLCQNAELVLSVDSVDGATYSWGPASAIIGSTDGPTAQINTASNTQVYLSTLNTNGCVSTDTIQVTVTPSDAQFNITANGPVSFCQGESVVLQATTGNQVVWSNGLLNFDEIEVTESGSYFAIFTGSACPAYSDTIEVLVIPNPAISILPQGPTSVCEGICVTLNSSSADQVEWTLADGSTSNLATIQACDAGWYVLRLTENGCTGVDSILITVAPALVAPVITLDGSDVLCEGLTTATLVSSYAAGNQWSLNNNVLAGETNNTIEVSLGGSYTVTVISPEGCTATSAPILITVKPVVPIDITAQDSVVCNDEVVNIPLTATGGFEQYLWDPTGETTAQIVATSSGTYTVTGITADGCPSSSQITITQNVPFSIDLNSPIKFDDFNVSAQGATDGSIDLTISGGVGPFAYSWSNGSTNEDLSNLAGGTYTVTVTDAEGCPVIDSILVKEPQGIKLPNGFTPNGDGFNDFYVIKGIQGYPGNKVNIFNRWGNLVYSKQDYNNDWDGVSNDGNLLPDGTYFIVVDLNKDGVDNLENYIDLRRK